MADEDKVLTDDDFVILTNGSRIPKDGSWIPKDRFNEATKDLQGKLDVEHDSVIRLQEQMKTLQENQQATPLKEVKIFSLSELRAAVENGTISQEESDRTYTHQLNAEQDKKLKKAIDALRSETVNGAAVSTSLSSYIELIPDISKAGSKDHTKLKEAYGRLTATLGLPKEGSVEDQKMQLVALETAFGPIAQLRQRRSNQDATDADRETHQEFESSDSTSTDKGSKFQQGLSKTRRDYYAKAIDGGRYADWKAVEAEMKYAKS